MTKEDYIELVDGFGYTGKQVAEITGRSEQTVSNWRNGKQRIPIIVRIAIQHGEPSPKKPLGPKRKTS